jgi:hypothetical protein
MTKKPTLLLFISIHTACISLSKYKYYPGLLNPPHPIFLFILYINTLHNNFFYLFFYYVQIYVC